MLYTLKGGALEVGTLDRAGHLCVIMNPFGTHLVKEETDFLTPTSRGILPKQN